MSKEQNSVRRGVGNMNRDELIRRLNKALTELVSDCEAHMQRAEELREQAEELEEEVGRWRSRARELENLRRDLTEGFELEQAQLWHPELMQELMGHSE